MHTQPHLQPRRNSQQTWIVALVTALVLNVVALTVPFMKMQVYTKPAESYSIPRTVQLMWEFKLYWVAVLIVGFSLLFPFVAVIAIAAEKDPLHVI